MENPNIQKCHSGFISESISINMLRDPGTSLGWQTHLSATDTNYKRYRIDNDLESLNLDVDLLSFLTSQKHFFLR